MDSLTDSDQGNVRNRPPSSDRRAEAARYYDLSPDVPGDVSFYRGRVPSPAARVLELGCGTGRVLVPLAKSCREILGLDRSEAMLEVCREWLRGAGLGPSRASARLGDISNFSLGRTFDWIIAPFRVFQNLESDAEVGGLFRCVREHLAPGGSCMLNVFRPYLERERLRQEWSSSEERFCWEVPVEGGRVMLHDRRARLDPERLVLYPELIYRRYEGDRLVDETVLRIVMRCYYPDDFEALVKGHGFEIIGRWGGYVGEPYGEGPELVLEFRA